ncbi:hypothetical protein [Streptomyces sp. NPDC055287]
MDRQEMRRKVFEPLSRAGLRVIEGGVPEAPLPAFAVGAMVHCNKEEGRRDAYVDFDDPHLIDRATPGWYELASSFGLFDADREFLLALPAHRYNPDVNLHRRYVWRRAPARQLGRHGRGVCDPLGKMRARIRRVCLGTPAGRPGFAMLSLDSTVSVVGTTFRTASALWRCPTQPARRPCAR